MAKYSELDVKDEPVSGGPQSGEPLPEQRVGGGFNALPQPGTYNFKLPVNLDDAFGEVPPGLVKAFRVEGQRVEVRFDSEHPLYIVGGEHDGERFDNSINNVERNRAPKGQPEVKVPDMVYLLQALGEKTLPLNGENKKMLAALARYPGIVFTADIEWTARSRADKVRYIYDYSGKVVKDPTGQFGSGKNWYQSQIPKENGLYLERFADAPGPDGVSEAIRCFASLTRFKPYEVK